MGILHYSGSPFDTDEGLLQSSVTRKQHCTKCKLEMPRAWNSLFQLQKQLHHLFINCFDPGTLGHFKFLTLNYMKTFLKTSLSNKRWTWCMVLRNQNNIKVFIDISLCFLWHFVVLNHWSIPGWRHRFALNLCTYSCSSAINSNHLMWNMGNYDTVHISRVNNSLLPNLSQSCILYNAFFFGEFLVCSFFLLEKQRKAVYEYTAYIMLLFCFFALDFSIFIPLTKYVLFVGMENCFGKVHIFSGICICGFVNLALVELLEVVFRLFMCFFFFVCIFQVPRKLVRHSSRWDEGRDPAQVRVARADL